MFQAEGSAGAKALGWELARPIQEIPREGVAKIIVMR